MGRPTLHDFWDSFPITWGWNSFFLNWRMKFIQSGICGPLIFHSLFQNHHHYAYTLPGQTYAHSLHFNLSFLSIFTCISARKVYLIQFSREKIWSHVKRHGNLKLVECVKSGGEKSGPRSAATNFVVSYAQIFCSATWYVSVC